MDLCQVKKKKEKKKKKRKERDFFFDVQKIDSEWALASELLDKKLEEFAEEPVIIVDENSVLQSIQNLDDILDDPASTSTTSTSTSTTSTTQQQPSSSVATTTPLSPRSATSTTTSNVPVDESDLCWDQDKNTGAYVIRGGSLERLVERATHPELVDTQYIRELLLSLRSFTEPPEFLNALVARFRAELPSPDLQKKMQLRVFNLLKTWISANANDFQDNDALINDARDFAAEIGGVVPNAADALHKLLAKRRTGKQDRTRTIIFSKPPPKTLVPTARGPGSPRPFYWAEAPLTEIARQMTLIEHDLYRSIQAWEFFKCGWSKKGKEQSSPNVLAMVQRFNQVSQWVAHEVLRGADPKARANRVQQMIELAQQCEELNNFNGIMEVLAGIDNSAIYRLKRTWALVGQKYHKLYDRLKAQMSSSGAYKAQRDALHQCKPPCVPYLGMYLTDLTFIEDGNKDEVEHQGNRLINFRKRRLLATVLSEIQIYQQTPYCLTPITYIQLYLMGEKPPNNEELFQLSLQIEPRNLEDDSPLPPHPCPVDDTGQRIEASAFGGGGSDSTVADDANGGGGDDSGAGSETVSRSSEKRGMHRFVHNALKAAHEFALNRGMTTNSLNSNTASPSGSGSNAAPATQSAAAATRTFSSPQLTNEDVTVRIRVPGVRARVDVTLPADQTIGNVVAAARAQMPANHIEALKRYEPFRLCLTSDDNGVLDRQVIGDCGLVLDDSRAVRSIPPNAYLWLSPMPCMVRVCNTLDQVARAGAALVSGGTPLSYIALTFRRANAAQLPAEHDVCFALYEQSSVRWLRSSRSLAGHALCPEPDASGLRHVGGVLVCFSADLVGAQIDARRAASCATISSGLAIGTPNDHKIQWIALVEFLLLVYNTPNDDRPGSVFALDNFSCSKTQPLQNFIQLRRRDGGDSLYLHGATLQLQQWMSHLLVLEQSMGMPCSVLGMPPMSTPALPSTPAPKKPLPTPKQQQQQVTSPNTSDRYSQMDSRTSTHDLFMTAPASTPPSVPRRESRASLPTVTGGAPQRALSPTQRAPAVPVRALSPSRGPASPPPVRALSPPRGPASPPPVRALSPPPRAAAGEAPLSPRAQRTPQYQLRPMRANGEDVRPSRPAPVVAEDVRPARPAPVAQRSTPSLPIANNGDRVASLARDVDAQNQQAKELRNSLTEDDEQLRVAEERRERLRQIRAERQALAERRAPALQQLPPQQQLQQQSRMDEAPMRPAPMRRGQQSPSQPVNLPPTPTAFAAGAPAPIMRRSITTMNGVGAAASSPPPAMLMQRQSTTRILPATPPITADVCGNCGTPKTQGRFCMSCGQKL
jgi:hypothetical protein